MRQWDARNTCQVFDWLWSSGQLSPDDIDALPALGVRNVINLALPTSNPSLPGEAERVTGQGLCYLHLPVQWESPQLADIERFARWMQLLEGEPTWVHCAMNLRASTFIYLYRRHWRGESEDAAAEMMNRVWTPNAIWQTFMAQVRQAKA